MARGGVTPGEEPLYWVGSSKKDLLAFPDAVKDHLGVALSVAQFGGKHPDAKPWKGEGSGVLEIVEELLGQYMARCLHGSFRKKRQAKRDHEERDGDTER